MRLLYLLIGIPYRAVPNILFVFYSVRTAGQIAFVFDRMVRAVRIRLLTHSPTWVCLVSDVLVQQEMSAWTNIAVFLLKTRLVFLKADVPIN